MPGYGYDDEGKLVRVSDDEPAPAPEPRKAPEVPDTTKHWGYDDAGRLKEITGPPADKAVRAPRKSK